jgi:hypothetical protein
MLSNEFNLGSNITATLHEVNINFASLTKSIHVT